jgi:methylglutaconyl-CoA hydratase
MSELVLVEPVAPGCCVVTLNRADKRNALSIALLRALCGTLDRLEADPIERVVILRGAGPVFSAGLDLKEASDPTRVEESAHWVETTLTRIRTSSLIVIAAAQGAAYAGGAGLMAACDLVVAADDLKIGFPEARRGLLPALICDVLIPKVKDGDLRDLFLVGEPIDAHRAQQIGLVQRVTPSDQVLQEATRLAREILAGGPDTIRRTKELLNSLRPPPTHANTLAAAHLAARRSEEAQEGLAAFLEKRNPNWIK